MKHNQKINSRKNKIIPLTRINWEEEVTKHLQKWIQETAEGRFKDYTQHVESYFENLLNRPCIAVSSGTAALHLALRLSNLRQRSEVIIPSMTYAACANVVLNEGLKPVFCDVNPQTWCLDIEKLAEAIKTRLKTGGKIGAVMPVHLYGQVCPTKELKAICEEYDISIIEDAAQALGGKNGRTLLGGSGDYSCFSFNANKVLSGMGGGLLAVRTKEEKHLIRNLIRHGRMPFENGLAHYIHEKPGFNYQISGYSAALINAQLPYLDNRIKRKREIFDAYCKGFQELGYMLPQNGNCSINHTRWLSCFQLKSDVKDRDNLCQLLWRNGIEARPVFKPLHQQLAFKDLTYCGGEHANKIAESGICLPSSCDLTEQDQEKVIYAIEKWYDS